MKSEDEVDWPKNVLKNALPNKTVKSDLVLTSIPTYYYAVTPVSDN